MIWVRRTRGGLERGRRRAVYDAGRPEARGGASSTGPRSMQNADGTSRVANGRSGRGDPGEGPVIPGRNTMALAATPRVRRIQTISLALLVTAGVVNYVDRATLAVANPLIREDLGLSIPDMGLLLSAFLWAYAFAQLPAGALADRLGPRLTLTLGLDLLVVRPDARRGGDLVLAVRQRPDRARDRRGAAFPDLRPGLPRLVQHPRSAAPPRGSGTAPPRSGPSSPCRCSPS